MGKKSLHVQYGSRYHIVVLQYYSSSSLLPLCSDTPLFINNIISCLNEKKIAYKFNTIFILVCKKKYKYVYLPKYEHNLIFVF